MTTLLILALMLSPCGLLPFIRIHSAHERATILTIDEDNKGE